MYQDNSIQTNKANDGTGILADSDSLAFCVSEPTRRKPTHHDIIRFRNAKLITHNRLWNELIGKNDRTGRYCC